LCGDLARIGHGVGERHAFRMPGRGPRRMSSTTRSAAVDAQKLADMAKPGRTRQ
jgi:hypothetical protein